MQKLLRQTGLFAVTLLLTACSQAQPSPSDAPGKALVIGSGGHVAGPDSPLTHPQGAKNNFLKLVGNPENDPAKGWTCDMSWDLMERLGMDPYKTSTEQLFSYIGAHHLGYRIVMQNSAFGSSAPYWDAAVDNGMMPFAPQGNNNPGLRVEDTVGLKAAVSVAGGSRSNSSSYGPNTEFIDALPTWLTHTAYEDAAQSWANQVVAAKFAHVLDTHPGYNIWDAREYLRQAASGWASGWNEKNGYGRIDENAKVDHLLPGPPVDFKTMVSEDRNHVLFSWHNFLQSDFAATVIARKDGRVIYDGRGTNYLWTSDVDGQETFTYWSRNTQGEKSRMESYQTRTVTGLSSTPRPTPLTATNKCLVFGPPPGQEAALAPLVTRFRQVDTNWYCDYVYRSASGTSKEVATPGSNGLVAYLPDFAAMVDFAITNHYRIVLVPVTFAEGDLFRFKAQWDRATAAGVLVVIPHSAFPVSSSNSRARRPSPPRLFSAITVGEGVDKNLLTFGPGLEFYDSPDPRFRAVMPPTQMDAAGVIAGKLAEVLDANPSYNIWDARQHLRQSSSNYKGGWVEDGGYGRPPARPIRIQTLDPAPPLDLQAVRSGDGKSVDFSWQNFLQTSYAKTLIKRANGEVIYQGTGTNYVWQSDTEGTATFTFFSQDKSGRLSRAESYTVFEIGGLKKNQP